MSFTEDQLSQIFYEYADMVYRVCFTYLRGNKMDAEDAAQITFLNLIRADKPEILNIKAWLIVCATNNCKNILTRSHKKDIELDDCYVRTDKRDETLEIILQMPKFERMSVYLHYYEGYSAKEIGKMLGKSESTIWGYLHKGRKILGEMLKEGI